MDNENLLPEEARAVITQNGDRNIAVAHAENINITIVAPSPQDEQACHLVRWGDVEITHAEARMLSSTAWPMLQRLLQICLTWIIPLDGTSTMRLWMCLRKMERLSSRLAPRSIQSVAGLRFRCRTTISRNVCFTPMRMGTTWFAMCIIIPKQLLLYESATRRNGRNDEHSL